MYFKCVVYIFVAFLISLGTSSARNLYADEFDLDPEPMNQNIELDNPVETRMQSSSGKSKTKQKTKSKSKQKSKLSRQENIDKGSKYESFQNYNTGSTKRSFLSHGIGLGINWMLKKEFGELNQKKVVPELSFLSYFNFSSSFFLKHSLRIGYSWMKPQMPQVLQVSEEEFIFLSDLGALYNWYVVPSLYIGCGSFYRETKLKAKEPIHVEKDEISDSEWIFVWYAQFGVATPVLKDVIVLEPYIRFLSVKNDKRINFSFGAELSYYIVRGW